MDFTVNESVIPRVETGKFLMDEKFTWTQNAEQARSKAKQAIGRITRLTKGLLPTMHLKTLLSLTAKVLPILLYAQVACYPHLRRGQI